MGVRNGGAELDFGAARKQRGGRDQNNEQRK